MQYFETIPSTSKVVTSWWISAHEVDDIFKYILLILSHLVMKPGKEYETLCTIWYHFCNLKNLKNTHGGVLLLVKFQAHIHWCFSLLKLCKWYQIVQSLTYMVWRGVWDPPFNLGPPVIQGSKVPLSASQYYMWPPKTVLLLRWLRGTFEYDQPYKQTESEMQVTGKISSNK